jgi:hypothetical protein
MRSFGWDNVWWGINAGSEPLGRTVYPKKSIFAMTVQQYEYGNTDHLDDLMYDPLVLNKYTQ